MNKNINIPGRLHSVATDGQVAGANEIYDDNLQKFQQEVNTELHEEMEDAKEVVGSFDDRVKAIEDLAEISIEGGEVQVANTADEIVAGSGKIPTANAVSVLKEDLLLGAVYDVSAKNPTAGPNNDGKWESLSALLSDTNINTLIPTSVRKGGMSIKFVQSSDNKYVQYRLMSDTFNTTIANWQGVDDVPTAGSGNLVTSGGVAEINKGVAFKKLENLNISLNNVGQIVINYGSIGSSTTAHHSNMMSTDGIRFLYVKSYVNSYTCGVFFYKENTFTSTSFVGQAILSPTGAWVDGYVLIPSNAKYMAFCSYKDGAEAYTAYYTEALSKEDGATIQNIIDEKNRAEGVENTLQQNITALANAGYVFKGVVVTSYNPGTPTTKSFYIAGSYGTYTNFNSLKSEKDELTLLLWDGTAWSKQSVKRNFYLIFNANEYLAHTNALTLQEALLPLKRLATTLLQEL